MEDAAKIWDYHCSSLWSYFPEEVKQLIQFFLSKKIRGKNLDLGSGWYAYHPNSTVIDLSAKGLGYNIAREKILFNLDEVGEGKSLPFRSNSFQSATLVSVWQYLRNRKLLLGELERVLSPGSTVYIINQPGSCLRNLSVGPTDPSMIENEVKEWGYECVSEIIPFGRYDLFESVNVDIPHISSVDLQNLFQDKPRKIKGSEERAENPKRFYNKFAVWETKKAMSAFKKLRTYPITKLSQECKEKFEDFSEVLQQRSGSRVLVFKEHSIPPSLHLATPGRRLNLTVAALSERKEEALNSINEVNNLIKEYKLDCAQFIGYMGVSSLDCLDYKLQSFPEQDDWQGSDKAKSDLNCFTEFLSSIPVTEGTKFIQKRVYGSLKPKVGSLDEMVIDKQMRDVYLVVREHKQRRIINELIEAKERILNENIPIIGQGKFDCDKFEDYYLSQTKKRLDNSSKHWPPSLSDEY